MIPFHPLPPTAPAQPCDNSSSHSSNSSAASRAHRATELLILCLVCIIFSAILRDQTSFFPRRSTADGQDFLGSGCTQPYTEKLISFIHSVPPTPTSSNITHDKLMHIMHLHKATINAIRISQLLQRTLHAPLISQPSTANAPALKNTQALLSYFNTSRIFTYFPLGCITTLKTLPCTPQETVLACAQNCPTARSETRVVRLPSSDNHLLTFAYRNAAIQRAKCVLISAYNTASAHETAATLDYLSTNAPRIEQLFLSQTAVTQNLTSSDGLNRARALFRRAPWRSCIRASATIARQLYRVLGTRRPFSTIVFPPATHSDACPAPTRGDGLQRFGVQDGLWVVVQGELFGASDLRDVLQQGLRRFGSSVGIVRTAVLDSVVVEHLLVQEAISTADDCVAVVGGSDVGFSDVLRLEKLVPLCRKIRFIEENCSYVAVEI